MHRMQRAAPPDEGELVFLFPLVYRPHKPNFAGQFRLLSRWYRGHIVALSGSRQRHLPVSNFHFHSEIFGKRAILRVLLALWTQVAIPFRLLWRRARGVVIIAYDPYKSGLAACALKYLLRSKIIVQLNGDYHRAEPGRLSVKQRIMRFVFGLTLRRADAIKVLNIDQEAFCRRVFPGKPVYRFPDFVATDYFGSLETYQGDYLLSIGHPFDLKGVDLLIAAFLRIADQHPRIHLRIMGYCPPRDEASYRALAQGHPRIHFVQPGWIEDVAEQIRGCYALVNAARSEAMGRVHIEAMACGKPIVASRTNGALQCIRDGQTGLLCERENAEDLAAKLDALLSNPRRADQMGQAGRQFAHESFSEEVFLQAYRTMLTEVSRTGSTDEPSPFFPLKQDSPHASRTTTAERAAGDCIRSRDAAYHHGGVPQGNGAQRVVS